jgi:hypothetical protein
MPLSRDPDALSKRLSNLKPNAASTHSVSARRQLAPRRESATVELRRRFPSADDDEISLMAHRRAMLELPADWMGARGLFQNRQRGIPFPAVLPPSATSSCQPIPEGRRAPVLAPSRSAASASRSPRRSCRPGMESLPTLPSTRRKDPKPFRSEPFAAGCRLGPMPAGLLDGPQPCQALNS